MSDSRAEEHQNRVRFLIKRIAAHGDTYTALDMPRIEELAYILMKAVQEGWEPLAKPGADVDGIKMPNGEYV